MMRGGPYTRAAVSAWLLAAADRWEGALRQEPPDHAALADLPRLPDDSGIISIASIVDEVRWLAHHAIGAE